MQKLKLMTIIGTRPEIIRLAPTIKCADKYFDHILVHTGQNYDYNLNDIFFDELGLRKPDYYLNVVGKNLGETMGNIISYSYDLIIKEKPDAILILGDTNSSLAAISAKRLKCPVFHYEAGNRCWDWNVSEMINRTIVDHIADVNIAYTENARRNLLQEGIDANNIFVIGSPMKEVLDSQIEQIKSSKILNVLGLQQKRYFVVSLQREENVDNASKFFSIVNVINEIAKEYKLPIVISVHPRTRKKIEELDIKFDELVRLCKPFGINDYCNLEKNAFCVLSDSGTLSEESYLLRFPAVLLRTSTERPEALDTGTILISCLDKNSVFSSIKIATSENKHHFINKEYDVDIVSEKIIKIIQSYIDIINITTWHKGE